MVLWLTGLSGSGKSTLAKAVKKEYPEFVILDGDVIRKSLCEDLDFTIADRKENMRRLIALCQIFANNNINVITAFISPFEKERRYAKKKIKDCHIIYCKSSLERCIIRDTKGLYKRAQLGMIKEFTGISSPFEYPEEADLIINTEKNKKESINEIIEFIKTKKN